MATIWYNVRLVSLILIFLSLLLGIIAMFHEDYIDATASIKITPTVYAEFSQHIGLYRAHVSMGDFKISTTDQAEFFPDSVSYLPWSFGAALLIVETILKGFLLMALVFRHGKNPTEVKPFGVFMRLTMISTAIVSLIALILMYDMLKTLQDLPGQQMIEGMPLILTWSMHLSMQLMIVTSVMLVVGLILQYCGWRQEVSDASVTDNHTDLSIALIQPKQVAINMNDPISATPLQANAIVQPAAETSPQM